MSLLWLLSHHSGQGQTRGPENQSGDRKAVPQYQPGVILVIDVRTQEDPLYFKLESNWLHRHMFFMCPQCGSLVHVLAAEEHWKELHPEAKEG